MPMHPTCVLAVLPCTESSMCRKNRTCFRIRGSESTHPLLISIKTSIGSTAGDQTRGPDPVDPWPLCHGVLTVVYSSLNAKGQHASLQMNCPSVRHWDYIRHNLCCRGLISNPRPVLDSSSKSLDFFKPQNMLVRLVAAFYRFPGGLGTILAL